MQTSEILNPDYPPGELIVDVKMGKHRY